MCHAQVLLAFLFVSSVRATCGDLVGSIRGEARAKIEPGESSAVSQEVAHARVTLFRRDLTAFWETRSDRHGCFSFARVPPGVYRLGASAERFEYRENEVSVGTGGETLVSVVLGARSATGRWRIIGDTSPEFLDASNQAALLPDGRIFYCHDTLEPILFDPATGAKTYPPSSGTFQGCSATTLLADGRVLFVGGQKSPDFRDSTDMVKAFDPVTLSWEVLPHLNETRWYPGLARLPDQTLIAMGGGQAPNAERTDTCELFDPLTHAWTLTDTMAEASEYSPAALLLTGEVLKTWSPPELFNPTTKQWRFTGSFVQQGRGFPDHSDHSLVLLEDGRALALGVKKSVGPARVMGEAYDPVTGSWSLTANVRVPRSRPEVVLLPTGDVFVAAGDIEADDPSIPNKAGVVKLCDLYEPDNDRWIPMADMNEFREYHATTLLIPDGRVVTTGGTNIKFTSPTSKNVEAFEPPYLFRGVRPSILAISSGVLPRGSTATLRVFPATTITKVVLIGTSSVTHWIDAGIPRLLSLPFTQLGQTLSATIPSSAVQAPLGYYMLFLLVDDIPSVGVIVRVSA